MGWLLQNTRLSMFNATLDYMVIKINLPLLTECDPMYEEKVLDKATELYLQDKSCRLPKKPLSSAIDIDNDPAIKDTFIPVPVIQTPPLMKIS